MDFYTILLRENIDYWIVLCLENGLVSQGNTKENAVEKLKTIEGREPTSETYELRAVHA